MKPVLSLIASCLLFWNISLAQQKTDSVPAKQYLIDTAAIYDSLEKEFNDLIGNISPKSYFEASLGVSNQVFSLQNSFLNATQSKGTLVLKPGISYYHKSGFSLGLDAYAAELGKYQLYQYAITPAFDLQSSKKISLGFSFTHYFASGDSIAKRTSPYENEFFAYVGLKKGVIKPVINFGWAKGKYEQSRYLDTVNRLVPFVTNMQDISLSAGISHEFEWTKVFSKKDGLTIEPALMLNGGQFETKTKIPDDFKKQHPLLTNAINNFLANHPRFAAMLRRQNYSSDFELQSLSLTINMSYSLGKHFTLSPAVGFDYYLHETSSNQLTTLTAVNFSWSF